jgi:DNA-directed RNA polymerase subunit L
MNGKLYVVPVGVYNGQMAMTIELYVSELGICVNSGTSCILAEEDSKEKYEGLREIAEVELTDEDATLLDDLKHVLEAKESMELTMLQKLQPTVKDAIDKMRKEPQIQIATPNETAAVLQEKRSGLIIEP